MTREEVLQQTMRSLAQMRVIFRVRVREMRWVTLAGLLAGLFCVVIAGWILPDAIEGSLYFRACVVLNVATAYRCLWRVYCEVLDWWNMWQSIRVLELTIKMLRSAP